MLRNKRHLIHFFINRQCGIAYFAVQDNGMGVIDPFIIKKSHLRSEYFITFLYMVFCAIYAVFQSYKGGFILDSYHVFLLVFSAET